MKLVFFTLAGGNPIAINPSAWSTVTPDTEGGKDHNTKIGFGGPNSGISVRETYKEVVKTLQDLPTS